MSLGLKIAMLATFVGVMWLVKIVLQAGIGAYQWWFFVPVMVIGFGSAYFIDRSDAKKRQRDNVD